MQVSAEDRIFYGALIASALLHAGFLIQWSLSNSRYLSTPFKKIEVVYQQIKDGQSDETPDAKELGVLSQKQNFEQPRVIDEREYIPQAFMGQKSKFTDDFRFEKASTLDLPFVTDNKKITLSMVRPDKEVGAKHYEYEQRIGEKIKARANFIAGDRMYPPGYVFVAFILRSDGSLLEVKILEAQTKADEEMKGLVLRTIKESAPYPPFEHTNIPERTFKVNFIFSGL